MGYRMINGKACRVNNIAEIQGSKPNHIKNKLQDNGSSFSQILNEKLLKTENLNISKHAERRLKEVNFSEVDFKAIQKGFDIAKSKGSKNSVMLYKDVAIITSIENNTVITAIEKDRAKENIFTNIDSVVIL